MSARIADPLLLAALVACLAAPSVAAKTSDRRQPMNIDAGAQAGALDGNSVNVLSGGVTITQGTLDIRANRADIHQRNGDVARAVLTGSPVVLKQQMDDGSPMTARASKVDYDLQTEIVVFTGNVSIEQPRGTMTGQRVVYNLRTGRVDSGGEGGGRVKMTIQPKAKS
jgi:lipopolysaccharide export system protein LptA